MEGNHTWQFSGIMLISVLRVSDHAMQRLKGSDRVHGVLWGSRDHMICVGLNSGQLLTSQMPYILYCLSDFKVYEHFGFGFVFWGEGAHTVTLGLLPALRNSSCLGHYIGCRGIKLQYFLG